MPRFARWAVVWTCALAQPNQPWLRLSLSHAPPPVKSFSPAELEQVRTARRQQQRDVDALFGRLADVGMHALSPAALASNTTPPERCYLKRHGATLAPPPRDCAPAAPPTADEPAADDAAARYSRGDGRAIGGSGSTRASARDARPVFLSVAYYWIQQYAAGVRAL